MRDIENVVNDYEIILEKQSRDVVGSWTKIISNSASVSGNSLFKDLMQELLNKSEDFKLLYSDLNALNFDQYVNWHKEFLLDEAQNIKDGHNFNIFSLLKEQFDFRISETMHSKLIKFLLDTEEEHGQGNIFLLELLKLLGIKSPELGEWSVTAEKDRIDVLIQRKDPPSVILIENKSNWAKDQSHQFYRYWFKAIYLKTREVSRSFYDDNKDSYQIIYLSPNNYKQFGFQSLKKPLEDPFNYYIDMPEEIPMSVRELTFDKEIQWWLNECMKRTPATNHRVREYIAQYKMLCKQL